MGDFEEVVFTAEKAFSPDFKMVTFFVEKTFFFLTVPGVMVVLLILVVEILVSL